MLLYFVGILWIFEHSDAALDRLGKYYTLDQGSVGPPKIYRGGKLFQVQPPNGTNAWDNITMQNIQEVVKNVVKFLKRNGM